MKTRILLSTLILLLFFGNNVFAQEINPNFKAPQSWINNECGLMQLPTLDYNEFINYGGYAYSECGIKENSLSSYYITSYDEYFKKIRIETFYTIEDSCGNKMECTDYYLARSSAYISSEFNTVAPIGTLEDIESITGLPYSEYNNTSITAEQFINAGGFLIQDCYGEYPQVEYYDWGTNYDENTLPVSFIRTFWISDFWSGISYQINQNIDLNNPYPGYHPITVIPSYSGVDECNNPILPWIYSYQEFIDLGGNAYSDCGIVESSFTNYHSSNYDEILDKFIVSSIYSIEDACGNNEFYEDTYFVEPFFEIPKDIYSNSACGQDDVESATGLPYFNESYFQYITLEQFIAAGGSFKDFCSNQDQYYILYIDGPVSSTCPFSFTRTFLIDSPSGISVQMEQQITFEDITPPVFITQPQTIADIEYDSEFPTFESLEFTDNCGTPELTTSVLPYAKDENGYEVTYQWTLTDVCGNTTSTTTSFNVLPKPVEYCAASGNSSNEWIQSVSIGNQTNTSAGNGYFDYTNESEFNVESGSGYEIALVPGFPSKAIFEYWAVWIDFNVDGIFSDDEKLFTADKKRSTVTGTITIPQLVAVETRMRVAMSREGSPNTCGDIGNGEVEDYTIVITSAVPQAPVAAFSSDKTAINAGEAIQFFDNSMNNPDSWSWTFEEGEPATSIIQNPLVVFSSPGIYNVTLVVSNSVGSDITSSTITVTAPPSEQYCDSKSLSFSKEWIASVILEDINNSSNGSDYSDFTAINTSLVAGNSYSIQLTPGFSGKSQREFFKVWIDFNQNSVFDEPDEEVFSYSNAKSTISGNIQIPSNILPGNTRMRISMKANTFATACEVFDRGEVQDYSVSIIENKNATFLSVTETENNELIIYPNPAHTWLNIKYHSETGSEVKIYNSGGALVMVKAFDTNLKQIDISQLTSGVYYLELNTPIENIKTKFIKY